MQTTVFDTVYSGTGLSAALSKGLFDRFRSQLIWSLAFAGLMVGDMLRHSIAEAIILGIGLALRYRPEAGLPGILAPFALLLAIGFGWGWIFIVLGLVVRAPMAGTAALAQTALVLLVPAILPAPLALALYRRR